MIYYAEGAMPACKAHDVRSSGQLVHGYSGGGWGLYWQQRSVAQVYVAISANFYPKMATYNISYLAIYIIFYPEMATYNISYLAISPFFS